MSSTLEKLWEKIRDPAALSMVEALGIEIREITHSSISASMPVDHRTIQYYGMLHGGASVALAETLASIGALVHLDLSKQKAVGLEINANHIRGVAAGKTVWGEGKPLHIGKTTQVWNIEIFNEEKKLVCVSRCTLAILEKL